MLQAVGSKKWLNSGNFQKIKKVSKPFKIENNSELKPIFEENRVHDLVIMKFSEIKKMGE